MSSVAYFGVQEARKVGRPTTSKGHSSGSLSVLPLELLSQLCLSSPTKPQTALGQLTEWTIEEETTAKHLCPLLFVQSKYNKTSAFLPMASGFFSPLPPSLFPMWRGRGKPQQNKISQ